ncbi:MAG: hypothetical protein M1823_005068 [Watsoniomyces obsoletus]|nr:MAG: hypothetical protein M1823_005068 [Watsoniomyces obsoletus]
MPAHIKSALIGASVTIPITNGKLNMGTWQGIWYLEFRTVKHTRRLVATIQGEKMTGGSTREVDRSLGPTPKYLFEG